MHLCTWLRRSLISQRDWPDIDCSSEYIGGGIFFRGFPRAPPPTTAPRKPLPAMVACGAPRRLGCGVDAAAPRCLGRRPPPSAMHPAFNLGSPG